MFDDNAGLKTSACQYRVIVIAPPTGNRKQALLHTGNTILLVYSSSNKTAAAAYPNVHKGRGSSGEGPLIAACNFNCI